MAPTPSRRQRIGRSGGGGAASLTLIEHALCPLDERAALTPGLRHAASYGYTAGGVRRTATAEVAAADGLSPHDEFYLWGLLLSLALRQPGGDPELHATPYHVLRELGVVDAAAGGGKQYDLFRAALRRLAGVRYACDAFYDPVRGEHRRVAFGLLGYSLPLSDDSARAWRFLIDPQLFELCRASGGALRFDLGFFRELNPAERRLYLLLRKLFWRKPVTPPLDLVRLATDTLGFAPSLEPYRLKQKVAAAVTTLAARGVVELPARAKPKELFEKRGVGRYALTLARGPHFDAPVTDSASTSPLAEPLRSVGLDAAGVRRVLARYPNGTVRTWADITLAARERHGEGFFKKNAVAYLLDNLKAAAAGGRTPPDWWRDLRREEERRRGRSPGTTDDAVRDEAQAALERTVRRLQREMRGRTADGTAVTGTAGPDGGFASLAELLAGRDG